MLTLGIHRGLIRLLARYHSPRVKYHGVCFELRNLRDFLLILLVHLKNLLQILKLRLANGFDLYRISKFLRQLDKYLRIFCCIHMSFTHSWLSYERSLVQLLDTDSAR